MNKEVIFDNQFATMWYYPDEKIVHHRIRKFIYGQAFKEFLMAGTELIKKHGAKKWLSDDRNVPVLRKVDTDWGSTNWLPMTVEAGWKYWAIIQPEHAMGKLNNAELVEHIAKTGIIARYFTTEEEAIEWLVCQE